MDDIPVQEKSVHKVIMMCGRSRGLEGDVIHYGFIESFIDGLETVLRWLMDNIFVQTDPAGNIKPDKEKSMEKIDGAVAAIMALDRAVRHGESTGSVYDERGILSF